jgi:hypothetical protein
MAGSTPSFRALARSGAWLGEISRPEALAVAGREVVVTPARPKPTQVAVAKPPKPWPAAPDLVAIQGALRPPAGRAFAVRVHGAEPESGRRRAPDRGSLRIVPRASTEMAPLVLAPI